MVLKKKAFIIAILLTAIIVDVKILKDMGHSGSQRTLPIEQSQWNQPGFIRQETDYWEKTIKEYGVEDAYLQFKRDYAKSPIQVQHSAAHLMGKALYDVIGIEAITVCDNSFSFGCFHSSIGQALSHEGVEIVNKIDQLCFEKYGEYGIGCVHGIGHGLGEWFGPQNLQKQLEICQQLKWQKNLLGCSGGVFMEYNFPTTISQSGSIQSNPKERTDLHEPCKYLESYQESCYFELPNWWEVVLNKNYQTMGDECQKITNLNNKEACLIGIGNTLAPSHQYDEENITSACKSLVGSDAQNLCFAGAGWITYATPEYKDRWKTICLNAPDPITCIKKADIIGVIKP